MPVVDWLWDGFNAVVLSYGQARAGKTALLVGENVPPSSSRSSSSSSPTAGGRQEEEKDVGGGGGGDRGGGGGGGLMRDILRAIFDAAAATAAVAIPTAALAVAHAGSAETPGCEEEHPVSAATGARYDVLNPLAGSWSPSRHSSASPGDGFDASNPPAGDPETSLDADGATAAAAAAATTAAEAEIENGCLGWRGEDADGDTLTALLERLGAGGCGIENGGEKGHKPRPGVNGVVVALSAWEVSGKDVTDLFLPPSPDTGGGGGGGGGSSGGASTQASNFEAPNRNGRDSSTSNSNNRGIENSGQAAKGGRSRSRNRRGSGGRAPDREQSQGRGAGGGGGGGGGGTGRGRRRSSRGRSGSDDSTTTTTTMGGGGWPTGYPEGFLTVRAPSLGVALKLVDIVQGRRKAGDEARERDGRKGGGGGKNAAAAGAGAADAAKGHLFFRVVIYNALEETVSTLHVVDLAGGWEVWHVFITQREGCFFFLRSPCWRGVDT